MTSKIVINARSDVAGAVGAHFNLLIDGKKIGEAMTTATSKDYAFTADIPADVAHKVQVQFDNDALVSGQDRNLYVNKITINGKSVLPTDAIVKIDKGPLDGSSVIQGQKVMPWNGTMVVSADKSFFPAGTAPAPDPVPDPPPSGTTLKKMTSPVSSTHSGQVIENLDIYATGGDALKITHDNVIVRNVRVHHASGDGIEVNGAHNVTIDRVEVINSSPPSGISPESSPDIRNIHAYNAPDLEISYTTVREGSSGMYLVNSPGADIHHVDGYDFHGPFPRGQFVQFNNSGNSTLHDFYTVNDPKGSHPEDNVSVYKSPNVTIYNGVIDGNNSKTGVGIMFEAGSTGGRVKNVDCIRQGNGDFSSYVPNVIFDDTRSFNHINVDQGRGPPSSKGLMWNISSTGVSITNSTYTNPMPPKNVAWDRSKASTLQITEDPAAKPMEPFVNHFDWIIA